MKQLVEGFFKLVIISALAILAMGVIDWRVDAKIPDLGDRTIVEDVVHDNVKYPTGLRVIDCPSGTMFIQNVGSVPYVDSPEYIKGRCLDE